MDPTIEDPPSKNEGGAPAEKNAGLKTGPYKSAQTEVCATYWPLQRLKIRAALVPPKPKELESAYSTEALRATLGT
jgi:hypothetical protein